MITRNVPIPHGAAVVHHLIVRTALAVVLTTAAAMATALFIIVLVTKAAVLDDDGVARLGLLVWFVLAAVFGAAARFAWRRGTTR